jgi:ATP-dependent Clp protease ATP-binding subunit ClpC
VFERFTERARYVVVQAQDEARTPKHIAARVLESHDITVEEVRAQVARIVGQGDEVARSQIPFTPRAKRVLEGALRQALSLGHNSIGTEHILLDVLIRA